ncbi:MAG: AAA family ATPase [Selenomonadaceae bacterium]|nr:AAA family ATPase [Selenomonadaceae bacterium]
MALDLGRTDKLPEIREWYDGYNFGGQEIYNPWSVIQYFQEGCLPAPYWVNTSANGIIRQLVQGLSRKTESELQQLMQGESVCKMVHENVVYSLPIAASLSSGR